MLLLYTFIIISRVAGPLIVEPIWPPIRIYFAPKNMVEQRIYFIVMHFSVFLTVKSVVCLKIGLHVREAVNKMLMQFRKNTRVLKMEA